MNLEGARPLTETVLCCPLCASNQSTLFDRRAFRGLQVTNRLCRRCGFVYQSPRMAEVELQEFYAQEYRRLYQGSSGPNPKDLAVQTGRAEALLGFVNDRLPAVQRHLDIGSSAGILLERFHRHYGCQSAGIEPGEAYRVYSTGRGLRVYPTLDELQAAGEERFDLISLAHVLEHLPGPVEYLAYLGEQLLAPGGWLLLEVPNLYAHDCFEVAHLVSFSPHTLRETFQKAAFRPVVLVKHGKPRSELIPLYLTALARPVLGDAPLYMPVPERNVSLNRRFGLARRQALSRLFPRRAWLAAEGS